MVLPVRLRWVANMVLQQWRLPLLMQTAVTLRLLRLVCWSRQRRARTMKMAALPCW